MALANFAWIVAASGKRVLTIDWDLEAPGLHRYFRPFLVDPDLFETDGLIDAFWSLVSSALARTPSGAGGAEPEVVDEAGEALADVTRRLDWKFPTGGYLDFIGAGRQGGTYSERVNGLDWKRFYELGGAAMLMRAKDFLRSRYDWILIDSRTGVSDTSGICTMQMPNAVVACFTLNRQNIEGVTAILRSIRAFRSASVDGSAIEFFPLCTRIENAEQKRLEMARGVARPALAEFLPPAMRERPRDYWDSMEISYRPAYAFEEVLAAFGDSTGAAGAADTMLSQVELMAQRITGDATLRMPEITDTDRDRVLKGYAFGQLDAIAETSAKKAAGSDDESFIRGLLAKEQLWRKSDFRFRRLLSRRELDLVTELDRAQFGRNMSYYYTQSKRLQEFLPKARNMGLLSWGLLISAILLQLAPSFLVSGIPQLPLYSLAREFSLGTALAGVGVALLGGFWARDRPYGMKLSDAFFLVIFWPVFQDPPDYISPKGE
jgi:hypothetical protein